MNSFFSFALTLRISHLSRAFPPLEPYMKVSPHILQQTSAKAMNRPQHVYLPTAVEETSPRSATAIYLHSKAKSLDSPIFLLDDERLDELRSSWALSSRLDRLKKRHTPSAASSSSSCRSSTLDNRGTYLKKKKKKARQQQQQQLGSHSRWESLPPSPGLISQMPTTPKRGNDRPTLPKRQRSIDNSKENSKGLKFNEASRDQPLRAYRSGSFHEMSASSASA